MGSMWSIEDLKPEVAKAAARHSAAITDEPGPPLVTPAEKYPVEAAIALKLSGRPRIEMRERAANPAGMTAAEVLKSGWPNVNHVGGMPNLLMSWCLDKDFSVMDVNRLCIQRRWGSAVRQLFLRGNLEAQEQTIQDVSLGMSCPRAEGVAEYDGSPEHDARIRRANSGSNAATTGSFIGSGAASHFSPNVTAGDLTDVPIAVVGAGAAGVMLIHALGRMGFAKVRHFEKAAEPLGIWRNEHVYGRSRNNPRQVNFYSQTLSPAPGQGGEVRAFIQNLYAPYARPSQLSSAITEIRPGNLKTRVILESKEYLDFPIVVNCMGLGRPSRLSDASRMVTHSTNAQAGQRWQRTVVPNDMDGKRYVFIGLGNSTAEMLRQVHVAQDNGKDVDYRVLTHYPREAVHEPDMVARKNGKEFRVFRDVSVPNLVDYQGDLAHSRYDYFRALNAGRIISDVSSWDVSKDGAAVHVQSGRRKMALGYDEIYTLTGYKHPRGELARMSIDWDRRTIAPRYDYDGEFQRPRSDRRHGRTYKGYFGFGAVLDAPHNRNAIVIPGMAAQIGDLLMTLLVRASEWKRKGDK